jgi:hypothetical protein
MASERRQWGWRYDTVMSRKMVFEIDQDDELFEAIRNEQFI